MIVCIANPLLTWPDAKKVHEALMKLDFILVGELFMSSTACLADIVLPSASIHESDNFMYWGGVRATKKLADPPGEAWPDAKWINELAKRMGYKEYFWDNWEEEFDFWISPSGLTFKQLLEGPRTLEGEKRKPFKEIGWPTPSGKIEIYSKPLEDLGYNPIPRWEEIIRPVVNFEVSDEYPLIMTNFKDPVYISSMMRNLEGLRALSNEPVVHIHPDTAQKYGLTDDTNVFIETETGRIVQKLKADPLIDPRVVSIMFGWWFPEQHSNLHGWSESNCNILCPSDPKDDDLETGATQLRGVPCRVYPAY